MFEDRLTECARIAIANAGDAALEIGHTRIGTEHSLER